MGESRFWSKKQQVELVRKAADRIERTGLHKGHYRPATDDTDDDCPVCIYGALNWSIDGQPLSVLAKVPEAIQKALADRIASGPWEWMAGTPIDSHELHNPIVMWNDDPARTAAEVIQLLRDVADEMEAA